LYYLTVEIFLLTRAMMWPRSFIILVLFYSWSLNHGFFHFILEPVQYENFGHRRSWFYWFSPSWQIDGKWKKRGLHGLFHSVYQVFKFTTLSTALTKFWYNVTLCLSAQVIVADNYFTGSKDNLKKWIGHPRFELIRHGIISSIFLSQSSPAWLYYCI
jgi:hypothetical protein